MSTEGEHIQTLNSEPIAGPADLTINKKGEVMIPAMTEGRILKFQVPKNSR